jgi:hypothetical protein
MWSSYCLLWHCACAPFLHWPALQQLFLKMSLILQVLSRNGQTSTPEYLRLCKAVQSVNPKALLFDDADALSVLDKLKLNASQCRRPQQSLCATHFLLLQLEVTENFLPRCKKLFACLVMLHMLKNVASETLFSKQGLHVCMHTRWDLEWCQTPCSHEQSQSGRLGCSCTHLSCFAEMSCASTKCLAMSS